MNDFRDIPPIRLPKSEPYWYSYDFGQELDQRFPGQDADDFAMACGYNSLPKNVVQDEASITHLRCVQKGENDGGSWIWQVNFDGVSYFAVGWCDYTGWDCQSALEWYAQESD